MTTTVAIPLHRSMRWVDNVVANVHELPDDVTEVLVSDRTCLDDAAPVLRDRLGADPRVQVVAEPADLCWQDHLQLLVEQASGDRFLWMPHDDRFAPDWVPVLGRALDRHPDAWLAFGHMACVAEDGTTPAGSWPHPRAGLLRSWSVLRMQVQGEMGLAFRGLFDRRAVLDAGIRLVSHPDYPSSDMPWAFAVGLRSGFVHEPGTTTWKRFHPASAHARWGEPSPGSHERAALEVLRAHGPDGIEGLAMQAAVQAAGARARLRPRVGRLWRPLRRRGPLPSELG